MSVRDHVLRMPRTRRPIRTKEHQVMAHPRSDRPMGAIRFLVLWLLTLALVATQIAVPVAVAAPRSTTPEAAPAAPRRRRSRSTSTPRGPSRTRTSAR